MKLLLRGAGKTSEGSCNTAVAQRNSDFRPAPDFATADDETGDGQA